MGRRVTNTWFQFLGIYKHFQILDWFWSLGLGWGVPACLVLPTPPLSAGAGLSNLAVLLWPRIRFLSHTYHYRQIRDLANIMLIFSDYNVFHNT